MNLKKTSIRDQRVSKLVLFQSKVGTLLTESGVEVIGENSQTRHYFYTDFLRQIVIEFFINTFCIPLLWLQLEIGE